MNKIKRIMILFLVLVISVSMIVAVSALVGPEPTSITSDSSIQLLAANTVTTSFTVYPFTSNETTLSNAMTGPSFYAYRFGSSSTGGQYTYGYVIPIPASTYSGNFYIYGVYPVNSNYTSTNGWLKLTGDDIYKADAKVPSQVFYILTTGTNLKFFPDYQADVLPNVDPNGPFYIPAHTQTLYLYVFAYYPNGANMNIGAVRYPNAFTVFVPEDGTNSLASMSTSLSSISTNIGNINTKFGTLNTNTSNINSQLSSLNTKFTTLNTNTSNIYSSLITIGTNTSNISTGLTTLNGTLGTFGPQFTRIADSLETIASAPPSKFEQFENSYIEKFDDELSFIEDAITSGSDLLPGSGSVTDFASDLTSGLGLSGDSFKPSEFSGALDAFSGSGAVSAGGPWEFFSQEVANSLSGDTAGVGLSDDDYIYAWLDQSQRRYDIWNSSSP